jgi:hypothetical protein
LDVGSKGEAFDDRIEDSKEFKEADEGNWKEEMLEELVD